MILDRYLARELLYTLFAIFAVLMVILLSHQSVRYLADAAAGAIPGNVILRLIGLKAISFAGLVLPLALFLAVIASLGRLYRDSEMVVMAACGVGPLQVLVSVVRTSVLVGMVLALFSLYLDPWAADQREQVMDRARAKPELSDITPGRFQESVQGNTVYFVEHIAPNGDLSNLFIQYRHANGNGGILVADRGRQEWDPRTGDRFLILLDGYRYETILDRQEYRTMSYDRHGILIPLPSIETGARRREAIPTEQLFFSTDRHDRAELQWRWSLPLSAVLFAALGVPLSHSTPREGRYGKLFTGILLYVLFSNLLSVARNWMERGILPVEFGLWWVHGLLVLLIIFMMVDAHEQDTIREKFRRRLVSRT